MGAPLLRFALWSEQHAPTLAGVAAAGAVSGVTSGADAAGTLYTPTRPSGGRTSPASPPAFLVVLATEHPRAARWLAGSLATRLGALVWVPHTEAPDLASAISAVCAENALDPGRTVIVGEGGGCHAASALCGKVPSARIALLYPPALPGIDPHSFPTTLLQASATSPTRAGVVMLESSLRRAGVAVRETDYQ
ncbi:MAG: hypothetical protein H7146_02265, partial [Burkholderiaceae bacterium]|nr:hypothetical protein [Microbacteriaceae bacterium]